MTRRIVLLAFAVIVCCSVGYAAEAVKVYDGTVSIPAYDFTGRETQPPLFGNSSVGGKYPFLHFTKDVAKCLEMSVNAGICR